MVRLDRIWNGAEEPFYVTQQVGGSPVSSYIGLALEDWQAPHEVVLGRLRVVCEAIFPGNSWNFTRNSDGTLTIYSDLEYDITLSSGFAAFWGFTSTYYEVDSTLTSENIPDNFLDNQLVSITLPVLMWSREVRGDSIGIIWDTFWFWDLGWTTDSTVEWPFRYSFAIYQGDLAAWELGNRDGWIALRPSATSWSDSGMGTTSVWKKFAFRCGWLDPTIEVE